jgi:amidase
MRPLFAFLLMVTPALGQSVDGNWILEIRRFGEPDYRRLNLKTNGDTLTAKSGSREFEGKVNGNKVEFRAKSGPQFTGALDNGVLAGTVKFDNEEAPWKATREPGKSSAAKTHVFEPTQFHRQFSGAIDPALHIAPGDTVKTWSVDAGGVDPKGVRRSLGGNPLTGPFYVDGAMPGDTLVVHFNKIQLNRDTAGSGDSVVGTALHPYHFKDLKWAEKFDSSWKLDRQKGIAMLANPTENLKNYTVPLRPMLGCVATAPPARQAFRSGFLGPYGGNMDYNKIREGATLYLPVFQIGALLFVGDGHAAQGDGELTGDALETSMDIEFTIDLLPDSSTGMPRAENTDYIMASGIAGSLQEALQIATSELMKWVSKDYKLNPSEAAIVLGTAIQYDVAELVDPQFHVVAKLAKPALATLTKVP